MKNFLMFFLSLIFTLSLVSCFEDEPKVTFTVTYNANGSLSGVVPVDTNAYEQGSTVTVKANTGTLTKASCYHAFVNWNTLADGSGKTYLPGATFTMGNAGIILYAIYSPSCS
jgi:hypothetical protein